MKIIIKDKEWNILKELSAEVGKTLLRQISDAWEEMHFACMTWICGACMCEVESWSEFIDKEMRTAPGFPLADEEVMTCISGVKKDSVDQEWNIILKKIY